MFKEADKIVARNHKRSSVYIGMKGETVRALKLFVDKHVDVMFIIVYKPEGRNGSGFYTKVFFKSCIGSKG